MVKGGRLWWVTRPTRDLHDLESTIKIFADIASGKKWKGNRDLQKEFESKIPNKTSNVGRDGSGGRTWAAFLRMWGLWYDDQNVKITTAGKMVARGGNLAYQQIEKLIMNFQITSAYSEHKKLEDGFKIFPFRFILKILVDKRINFLKEDEIAFFIINVKTAQEYGSVIDNILKYRKQRGVDGIELKNRVDFVMDHMKKYRTNTRTDTAMNIECHLQYIKDIANTLINNIRYLKYVEYDDGGIKISDDEAENVQTSVSKHEQEHPFSNLYVYGEKEFAEHFGLRFDRKKASKKSTHPNTPSKKRYKRIKEEIEKIHTNKTISNMSEFIQILSNETGYNEKEIIKIISENPKLDIDQNKGIHDTYLKKYLSCAESGKDDVMFETMTRDILNDIGFCTNKHRIKKQTGIGKPEIDGLVQNDDLAEIGILECKSGAKYSFTIGDREKMKNVYIPAFKKYKVNGACYDLKFFIYVVGKKVTGFENFTDIIHVTKINGVIIYAKELIKIYERYKSGKVTKNWVWGIFQKNKHITWYDIGKD